MQKAENSRWLQSDNNVISLAHKGRDLRGRDFKKRMKERQVNKKKRSIRKGEISG